MEKKCYCFVLVLFLFLIIEVNPASAKNLLLIKEEVDNKIISLKNVMMSVSDRLRSTKDIDNNQCLGEIIDQLDFVDKLFQRVSDLDYNFQIASIIASYSKPAKKNDSIILLNQLAAYIKLIKGQTCQEIYSRKKHISTMMGFITDGGAMSMALEATKLIDEIVLSIEQP